MKKLFYIYIIFFSGNLFAANICPSMADRVGFVSNSLIKIQKTNKVSLQVLTNAINVANVVMKNISVLAKDNIAKIPIIIIHCDPTYKSGYFKNLQTGEETYNYFENYDYFSLIHSTDTCEYKNKWVAFDGRSVDQTPGYSAFSYDCSNGKCDNFYTTYETHMGVCDSNLYSNPSNTNKDESIFVHELAHLIMDIGLKYGNNLDKDDYKKINHFYDEVYFKNICGSNKNASYSCASVNEMWAEASQVWLNGTRRTDVNLGLSTIANIQSNAPELFDVLQSVYGPYQQYQNEKLIY